MPECPYCGEIVPVAALVDEDDHFLVGWKSAVSKPSRGTERNARSACGPRR